MSIKLYTVKCSVHGKQEIWVEQGKMPKVCPICGNKVNRVYDAPAIHYKGSGWAGKEK